MIVFSVPPPPENVTVSAKCGQICDVTVSWSMPELIPDAYLIFIYNFSDDGNDIINVTVPGVSLCVLKSSVNIFFDL